jgi:KDO2-lipid IV(A) lauroyltransferase
LAPPARKDATMKPVVDWFVYFAVRVLICVVQTLPIDTCQWWTRALAMVVTHVIPIRRAIIDENLRQAYPSMSQLRRRHLAQQMWEHLLLMLCEIAHAKRKIHLTNWGYYLHVSRIREITKLYLDARPTIILSGHFGNFEVGAFLGGLLGFPSYTIARPLDNPYLDRYVNRFRSATGQHILPKQGSAEAVQKVLERGGILAILGDQSAGPKGCWVNFFGRPASCHKAIALFSLTTGAPMMVMYAKRLQRPLQFEVGLTDYVDLKKADPSLASVQGLTEWYNEQLEKLIREAPQQYWWLHRRWKGTPPPAIARRLSAAHVSKPAA